MRRTGALFVEPGSVNNVASGYIGECDIEEEDICGDLHHQPTNPDEDARSDASWVQHEAHPLCCICPTRTTNDPIDSVCVPSLNSRRKPLLLAETSAEKGRFKGKRKASMSAVAQTRAKADSTVACCCFFVAGDESFLWSVALPAAGCLLRLITLPVAIDSERDRRQRQLIDPQFSRMKEKMKEAYKAGNTQEYQRLRLETKQLLKKHGVGVLPASLLQMVLLGVAISLATPAIRCISGDVWRFKSFAVEQPGWLSSLSLPDTTGLTAGLCWLALASTMAVTLNKPVRLQMQQQQEQQQPAG
ncbi:uncharacterized protein EMH_0054290 [Eimeria mitis]|uniref:Uncharacterized protein n=1 Tax=Eimeria mitis TaxID=44415 RepID=U6K2J1_9EIME|nr:uncharacterized protein EMH_0054290 [Eimeria mitis]CDJ29988.1 hypothetical protein, conserved [Eimeria mitis]